MSDKKITIVNGGLMNIMFIVFLVLKLTKVIDWSWWWITAPLWGQVALFVLIVLVIAIAGAFGGRRSGGTRCY